MMKRSSASFPDQESSRGLGTLPPSRRRGPSILRIHYSSHHPVVLGEDRWRRKHFQALKEKGAPCSLSTLGNLPKTEGKIGLTSFTSELFALASAFVLHSAIP